MRYSEEDMLMLSGIQHYVFCPRQWALIHLEQQWEENVLTIEGLLLHEHVDNPFYRAKKGDRITLRRVAIASRRLGLNGFSDAVELLPVESKKDAIKHPSYSGYWIPSLLNINEVGPSPIVAMRCKSLHRRSVWRRCMAFISPKE